MRLQDSIFWVLGALVIIMTEIKRFLVNNPKRR